MKKILFFASILLLAASCQQAGQTNNKPSQNNPGQASSTNSSQSTSSKPSDPGIPEGNKTGWNKYTSPTKYGFIIQYPNEFQLNGKYEQTQRLSYIPLCDSNMVACLYYAKDNQKNTNFEGAAVSLNVLSDSGTEANCTMKREGEEQQGQQKINNTQFNVYQGGGVAAGHASAFKKYRTFHNGSCIEVALRVNYGSMAVIDYENSVQSYNEPEVWNKLNQVLSTFTFTSAQSSTPAPSGQVTLVGTTMCLPHKNVKPGQPQTMECAIGLKDQASGKYYSLKNIPGNFFDTNVKVTVIGTVQPDSESIYDVVGAIDVKSITKVK